MIIGRELVAEVSKYLVDQEPGFEFTMVSEDELASYLRMAVQLFASHNKELFQNRHEVKLVPGAIQELPYECEEMNDVYGVRGADGEIDTQIRRTDLRLAQAVRRPVCRVSVEGEYKLDSYQYDPSNPRVIHVDPPIPADVDATLIVTCYGVPEVTNLEEAIMVPSSARPILFEFMLYYAYGVDSESVPARDRSNTHFQNGLTLMGIGQNKSANRYAYTRIPEARVRNG